MMSAEAGDAGSTTPARRSTYARYARSIIGHFTAHRSFRLADTSQTVNDSARRNCFVRKKTGTIKR